MKAFSFVLAALTLCGASPVQAKDSASIDGPIKLIVTFGPGSGGDVLARAIAKDLGARLQVPVIVDNKPGAGGNIGADHLARATPDGRTLMLATPGPLITNAHLYRSLAYDPQKDFATVALVGTYPNILVASLQSGIKNLADLRSAASRAPDGLAYASSGIGTTQHLAGELLTRSSGIKLLHVPYKATSTYVTDLAGGQLPLAFVAQAGVELIKNGRLTAIGVTSQQRSPTLPDIPTLEEQGIKGFNADPWYGIIAPARTPPGTVQHLNSHINAVLADPHFKQTVTQQLIVLRPMSPAGFQDFVEQERTKWTQILTDARIRLD